MERLYSDQDYYVKIQKTKLLLVVILLVVDAALGRFNGWFN